MPLADGSLRPVKLTWQKDTRCPECGRFPKYFRVETTVENIGVAGSKATSRVIARCELEHRWDATDDS